MSIKARVVGNTANFGIAGISVDLGTAQNTGVTVDNYSAFWLTIGSDGLFVPPKTLGWSSNFYGSVAGSVTVKLGAPTGAAQASTGDGTVVIAVYDTSIAPSPGVPVVGGTTAFTNNNSALAVLTGGASTMGMPNFVPYMQVSYWTISVICRTAAGQGRILGRIFDVAAGSRNLVNGGVKDTSPFLIVIPAFDLASILQQTPPASVIGDALQLIVGITDTVGVNTYDIQQAVVVQTGS